MTPITHAVLDEDGDVLSTHGLHSEAAHAAAGNRPGQDQIVALYDLSCFDLLETLMWNGHRGVWEVRARGSNVFHRSRLLREAVGLAVAEIAGYLAGGVGAVPAVPAVEEDALW